MFNLLIAFAIGLLVSVAVVLAHFPVFASVAPGVLVFMLAYLLLARRISNRVQKLVKAAQKELSARPANVRDQQQRVEKAVKLLQEGLKYERWQFLIGAELHAQVGMVRYMMKDYEAAAPELAHASNRNYMAQAMQAALFYMRKDYERMEKAFEKAVSSGKKEALVWAVYAWCFQARKQKDRAIAVLTRAVEKNPKEEKLKASLTALQNDKKMKMRAYEPMWWQFGLESPPAEYSGGRRVQYVRR